jgi:hypothetical protein
MWDKAYLQPVLYRIRFSKVFAFFICFAGVAGSCLAKKEDIPQWRDKKPAIGLMPCKKGLTLQYCYI